VLFLKSTVDRVFDRCQGLNIYPNSGRRYEDLTELGYIYKKTQKLLNFGVEKVIWITTSVGKVTVSTQEKNWETMDWSKDVEIMDGYSFNVVDYLKKQGIEY
jgi:hypothetical protein